MDLQRLATLGGSTNDTGILNDLGAALRAENKFIFYPEYQVNLTYKFIDFKRRFNVFFKQFERAEYKVSILQRMKDVLPFFKGKTDEEVPLIDGLVIKPQMLHMAVVSTP